MIIAYPCLQLLNENEAIYDEAHCFLRMLAAVSETMTIYLKDCSLSQFSFSPLRKSANFLVIASRKMIGSQK